MKPAHNNTLRKSSLVTCPIRQIITAALLCACSSAGAENRIWHKKNGESFTGSYTKEILGSLLLTTPDGGKIFIKTGDLCDQDLNYIRSTVSPETTIDALRKISPKSRNDDYVKDGDIIDVATLTSTFKKQSATPFTGTLRAEVYLIGREVITGLYYLANKDAFDFKFGGEKNDEYVRISSADFRTFTDFNTDDRGVRYAGYAVILFGADGTTQIAEKSDFSWLKETSIGKLRALKPHSFFDETCRKRSVPRPRYYERNVPQ